MRRAARALAAVTPVGAALVAAGTLAVLAADVGAWVVVPGVVVLTAGLAGTHGVLAGRIGDLAFLGLVFTYISFLLLFALGLGYASLLVATPLLVVGLLRMRPQLRASAVALVAIWPVAAAAAALTPLGFVEAFAPLFPLPYAVLALEALRLPQ